MKSITALLVLLSAIFFLTSCQNSESEVGESLESITGGHEDHGNDNLSEGIDRPACLKTLFVPNSQSLVSEASCKKASARQLAEVNEGNLKKEQFLSACFTYTNNSCWCDQLVRPNPDSIETFFCTYGAKQTHQLIHPDESTWVNAFESVKIVEELEDMNIKTKIIYNWWRPEPYNKNVGGAASRHPFGTSVDVRFETKDMQEQAFLELCKMRAQGRVRAVGYYASSALHFGVGDSIANTWGKACP